MSQYSDAHSAVVNRISSECEPLFVLRDTLAKAKEAEDYIAKSETIAKAVSAEIKVLKSTKGALVTEIEDIKNDVNGVRRDVVKRLEKDIAEKRRIADDKIASDLDAAESHLAEIEEEIISAKAIAAKSDIEAKAAKARLDEVNKALASAERDRKEAIAALQEV